MKKYFVSHYCGDEDLCLDLKFSSMSSLSAYMLRFFEGLGIQTEISLNITEDEDESA